MKNRWLFVPPFLIVIVFFIVGTFCDLSISQAIANVDNGFSRFFAGFVSVPLVFALAFIAGSLIKLAMVRYKKIKWRLLITLFVVIILVAAVFFGGYQFTDYDSYQLSSSYIIPIGLLVTIPGIIVGFIFQKHFDSPHIIKMYIFFVVTVAITFALTFGMKYCVARIRYSFLLQTSSLDYFRPWYNPNVPSDIVEAFKQLNKDAIRSFPSGHSNCAIALAFVMMFIPCLNKKLMRYQGLFFYIGFIYFLFIAFTRIYAGAHYLTDTMFSGLIALIIYFIANEIYMRKLINREEKYA